MVINEPAVLLVTMQAPNRQPFPQPPIINKIISDLQALKERIAMLSVCTCEFPFAVCYKPHRLQVISCSNLIFLLPVRRSSEVLPSCG